MLVNCYICWTKWQKDFVIWKIKDKKRKSDKIKVNKVGLLSRQQQEDWIRAKRFVGLLNGKNCRKLDDKEKIRLKEDGQVI